MGGDAGNFLFLLVHSVQTSEGNLLLELRRIEGGGESASALAWQAEELADLHMAALVEAPRTRGEEKQKRRWTSKGLGRSERVPVAGAIILVFR